jgi:hypothetical protein
MKINIILKFMYILHLLAEQNTVCCRGGRANAVRFENASHNFITYEISWLNCLCSETLRNILEFSIVYLSIMSRGSSVNF